MLTTLLVTATGFAGMAGMSTAALATTAPPWAGSDGSAVGGLTFFDASGNPITSGSTNTQPFAAYVQSNATIRTTVTDSKATLFFYLVQDSSNSHNWAHGEFIGAATDYPNASAPSALAASSLPLYSTRGASDPFPDLTPEDFYNDYDPSTAVSGYQTWIEVRLKTSSAGNGVSATYSYADITVDTAAHTWQLAYSPAAPATAPAAPTNVNGTAGDGQAVVRWAAPGNTGGAAIDGYDVQYGSSASGPWTAGPSSAHSSTTTQATVTGLVNGFPYYFEVRAHNSIGWSPYAVSSAATTPVSSAPTVHSTSITPSANVTIAYGKSTALAATLKDDTGAPVAGTMTLQSSTSTSGPWTSAPSTTVAPKQTTYYRWAYAGDATHLGSTSSVVTVSVSRTVTIAKIGGAIKKGKTIKIYGVVAPVAGGTVSVQKHVGAKWVLVGTAAIKKQKLPNNKTAIGYVYTYRGSAKGNVTLRAVTGAVAGYVSGTSPTTITVTVR
jgi:hypothetical protein